jgi:predicted alpha/beta-hydrolase family hydrolase
VPRAVIDELAIALPGGAVPALWWRPRAARAALVLAHGAGAGMRHVFMAALAEALAARAIATLRYEFAYRAAGRFRPDPPAVLEATVRAAVARARRLAPRLPLLAGGKSLGGRMTTRAMADGGLPGVRGVVLVGFPLHPAGRPSIARADHLAAIDAPMLFLQGTRDALADLDLVRGVLAPLPAARLHVVDGADHGFAVRPRPPRAGRDAAVLAELADQIAGFAAACAGRAR